MEEIEKIKHFTRLIKITASISRRLRKFLCFTILSQFIILCKISLSFCANLAIIITNFFFQISSSV